LDRETYKKIVTGSRDPETVIAWKAAVEKGVSGAPWLQKRGYWQDIFTEIWEWFLENWPAILKIILSLMVFIEPMPKSKDEEEDSVTTGREAVSKRQEWRHSPLLSNITQETKEC